MTELDGRLLQDAAYRQLVELVRHQEREIKALREQVDTIIETAAISGQTYPLYVAKASGTITALSGETLGTGQVELYQVKSDGDLVASGQKRNVKNPAGEISDGKVVCIQQEGFRGLYLATVEDCS